MRFIHIELTICSTSKVGVYVLLNLSTLLVEHIISSIWINRMMRSCWKFRIRTTTNDHALYSFPHYTFLWPEDGPQWPKHVVISLINRIQRQLCFDVPTPSQFTQTKVQFPLQFSRVITSHILGIYYKTYVKFL